jgi:Cu2+-containing amine oxidase
MAFNGKIDIKVALTGMFATTTIEGAEEQETWLTNPRNKIGGKFDHVHKHGIKQLCMTFELTYWKVGVMNP